MDFELTIKKKFLFYSHFPTRIYTRVLFYKRLYYCRTDIHNPAIHLSDSKPTVSTANYLFYRTVWYTNAAPAWCRKTHTILEFFQENIRVILPKNTHGKCVPSK